MVTCLKKKSTIKVRKWKISCKVDNKHEKKKTKTKQKQKPSPLFLLSKLDGVYSIRRYTFVIDNSK